MAPIDLHGLTDAALIEYLRDLRCASRYLGLKLKPQKIGDGEPEKSCAVPF
jgi:hypothetical protein